MIKKATNLLINIDVDDLDKAVSFYTQALGLRVGRSLEEGTPASRTISQERTYQRHWTPVHFDIAVKEKEKGTVPN